MDCVSPKGKCNFSISSDNKNHFMYEFLVGLIFQRRLQKSAHWVQMNLSTNEGTVSESCQRLGGGRATMRPTRSLPGSQTCFFTRVSIPFPELILSIPASIKCACLCNVKWHHPQPRTLGKKPLSRMLQLFGRRNCFFYFQFNFTVSFEEPHCFITTEDEMVGWHHRRDGHEFE